jgi:putative redox protein
VTTSDRIAGAVLGAFVADTLGLGVHWIYDPARIARHVGRLEGPIAPIPGAAKYHPNRARGQFTHYGDQMLVLLRSVAEAGGWSREGFAGRWAAMWDGYDGYVDQATRDTLAAGVSGSDDLAGCGRMPALLPAFADADADADADVDADESAFVAAARAQTAVTHGDAVLHEAGDFLARVLFRAVHGASLDDALAHALDHAYDHLPAQEWVEKARAQLGADGAAAAIAELGATCHVADAFPATIYLLLAFGDSLEQALIENAMAGGDSAGRGLLLGAILGARAGEGGIPAAWLEAMQATDEIRRLLGRPEAATAKGGKFEFANADGVQLAGALAMPDGEPRAHAVFAHCFTCGKDIAAATRIARALARRGIAVLRFDFTGLGNSDGDFANTGFSSNVDDLVAAADALRERHAAPALLVGHSLGGAAVLAAAHRVPEVRGVVTIGAPAEPSHVLRLLEGSREAIEREGTADVNLAGRTFPISRSFLRDLEQQTLADRIADLGRDLLIMHAPADDVVGIDNARQIFTAARHPKSFLSLADADHLLTRRVDSTYVADVIAAWAGRLLA